MHEISAFTDRRDGSEYRTVRMLDGHVWMAENFRFNSQGAVTLDDYAPSQYGRLYSFSEARMATPAGCRLPTSDDWSSLCGLYQNSVQGLADAGFDIDHVPMSSSGVGSGWYTDTVATYWTSSRPKSFFGLFEEKGTALVAKFAERSLYMIGSEHDSFRMSVRFICG